MQNVVRVQGKKDLSKMLHVTTELAIQCVSLPKTLGQVNGLLVMGGIGKNGPYLEYNASFLPLGNVFNMNLDTMQRYIKCAPNWQPVATTNVESSLQIVPVTAQQSEAKASSPTNFALSQTFTWIMSALHLTHVISIRHCWLGYPLTSTPSELESLCCTRFSATGWIIMSTRLQWGHPKGKAVFGSLHI
jgi:hypothetical protein